jgi:hypothetical protein
MTLFKKLWLLIGISVFLGLGCDSEEVAPEINLLSIKINGGTFTNNIEGIPVDATVDISFSAIIDPTLFAAQLSVTANGATKDVDISYSNSTSKATLTFDWEYNTTYMVSVNAAVIGASGEELKEAISLSFKTAEDNIIRSMPPCTNTAQCLESTLLTGSVGEGTFEFYSNYPIYEENAEWENLTQAVIVVHGASHNANDYFSFLTSTLNAESLSDNTVLIAPYFRDNATNSSDDFYWSSTSWRDGKLSANTNKISSFEVIDKLIKQLVNSGRFPVLDQIIVTGQSSGGRFTHVYAPSNKSESLYPTISFDYVVSESQYFYYPDGQRIDEGTNNLYTPSSCNGYDFWPFGYDLIPDYLTGTTETEFNQNFVNRSVHYLLGNGTANDPTLNTTNCSATLLGSSRYQRGENMFRYMDLKYQMTHNHSKTIANGITHNGSAIYQSTAFRTLLTDLLN